MISLIDLIQATRGQIPNEKSALLEELARKLQHKELLLSRQEFLQRVRDIAGEDGPTLRSALKLLAVQRKAGEEAASAEEGNETSLDGMDA